MQCVHISTELPFYTPPTVGGWEEYVLYRVTWSCAERVGRVTAFNCAILLHFLRTFCRWSDGLAVPGVHPVRAEGVPVEGPRLRPRLGLREGLRLRDGQVRQEEGQGQHQAELPDALHGGEGVPLQVSLSLTHS